ncbi:uncharacterized membrane protein at1g06890 [Phtheirospermum japonicum]|uniref:Uncharacterized membrane protein at1g06890 n=1 Tax=Phtheirospermum japonicum TaxID=374723 RepID=A0A830BK95_9LAMI|nr:uncharacterized membrane protein at1g06890 [Phtheirospermum japonicum]
MSEGKGFQLGTIGALSLSVVSSVSIVICNKALMSTLHFIFATTLTSWHLLVTYCSLHVALSMNFFEHKPIEFQTVIGFGILNGISIGLLNLSLGFNSVGFYQMTKLAIIPCTVFLETIFLGKTFSRSIKFSLGILLLGVGIATVTDLQLNMLGSILSFLAVITTCVAQIVFIVLSCLISISVNFSTFLVIGKTSPVTYQVLGHLKTCLVLAFGYSLLRDPFSWRNIFGIMVAMVGMILYSYYCTQENQAKAEEVATVNKTEEDESDPFIRVENGATKLNDLPLSKGTFWEADKDLRA